MRSLESRLNRIVRDITKAASNCPECGGAERSVLRVTFDDEPVRPVEPCPKCGRTPRVVLLVVCDGEAKSTAA